ncbi:hypothetical protein [Sphingomonas sp.]|uniref:hypothetical protein n=1 Tax=Sphingomonas sp. TaxID=28214 RepID=UPI00181E03D6|nr:hypothetical protein [Sphingomonas sp.]MBA3512246.1 hypothetical protein [Sphingomonas sp.]
MRLQTVGDSGGQHPPRVPFTLCVGVTGHRLDALPPEYLERLPGLVREALGQLVHCAGTVRAEADDCFAPDPTRLLFVSPLAHGADQIAAEVALELGFSLHAVLPFTLHDYRRDLINGGAEERFDELVAMADTVLELPGTREQAMEAYVMAGRATVAHCDVLIAVWDGLAARGRGGTAEVVQLAITRGTPVVHIAVDESPTRLLWSAFDPVVITERPDDMAQRPFDSAHVEQMLTALMLPPVDPQERGFLRRFATERARRIRARIEYPLLLAAAGVKRFRPSQLKESNCTAETAREWRGYRDSWLDRHSDSRSLDLLEDAYSWSDRLAGHFAQTYRSGHVFNFVLGGLAVCLGLSAFMAPGAGLELAMIEFIITLGIIVNTQLGVRNEWHRRWLDYRQLAERLRPMRSLKLLALAAPDPPGSITNPVARRWIDWYASGIWRAMGSPGGTIAEQRARELGSAVAAYEIAPQVAYHEKSARQIDALDSRLEKVANLLFLATLIVSAAIVLGQASGAQWVEAYSDWFTLVSAGFPALGTAVFGIRFQGDFGGSAVRSQATANALKQIQEELTRGVVLPRAADLAEQAARTMLSDLDEWRLVNQQQDLGIA